MPLNCTAVAPVNTVPVIVTLVPTGPLVGVKLVALVAVPPGVVTLIAPVVAPVGTVAWIVVAELTVKVALMPLNCTAVAPVNPVPVIVPLLPTGPFGGVKLVTVGGLTIVKL